MKSARSLLPVLVLTPVAAIAFTTITSEPAGLPYDATAIVGPDECGECHEAEVSAWRTTHHYRSFTELTRRTETLDMADKLGIDRVRQADECVSCHYTRQLDMDHLDRPEVIAGVSCEMCHGPSRDWLEPHADYGVFGTKDAESPEHRAERILTSVAAGMNHPDNIFDVARNCYRCHLGPDERIVNIGGHSPGSRFELVAWSQGEVRHNFADDPKVNAITDIERQRHMYVVGQALELAGALRGITGATGRGRYVAAHVARIKQTRTNLEAVAERVNVEQITRIIETLDATKVSLDNDEALSAAAATIEELARDISENVPAADLAPIDDMLPAPEDFHGEALTP